LGISKLICWNQEQKISKALIAKSHDPLGGFPDFCVGKSASSEDGFIDNVVVGNSSVSESIAKGIEVSGIF
jgi:hypothetical protein